MIDYKDDKRPWYKVHTIPLALVASVLVNGALGVWAASKFDSRVTENEKSQLRTEQSLIKLEAKVDTKIDVINNQNVAIGRIDANVQILMNDRSSIMMQQRH